MTGIFTQDQVDSYNQSIRDIKIGMEKLKEIKKQEEEARMSVTPDMTGLAELAADMLHTGKEIQEMNDNCTERRHCWERFPGQDIQTFLAKRHRCCYCRQLIPQSRQNDDTDDQ